MNDTDRIQAKNEAKESRDLADLISWMIKVKAANPEIDFDNK